MEKITILPYEIETIIERFISEKLAAENLHDEFPNRLLRDDVLDILDRFCTLVYYPLEGKDHNNGFRLKDVPLADGTLEDFVFINTAQRLEKQVFTAAHELGHIWDVDEYVISSMTQSKKKLDDTPEIREQIINRFAAVLLIPENDFKVAVGVGLRAFGNNKNNSITFENMIKLIVFLINHFLAPMKAIVYRFVEFGVFGADVAERLLGMKEVPKKVIDDYVDSTINEFGYYVRLKVTNKKLIHGLSDKLDIAEKNNLVSKEKIELMREKFGLNSISNMPSKDSVIPLES